MEDQQFAEYRDVRVTEPLRQGDVLESVDEIASMWQRHIMVITADCDFANDKNKGRVTCVPLLAADEYLAEMQMPGIREKLLVRKRLAALREVLATVNGPNISDNRLRDWASEEEPLSIVASLGLTGASETTVRACMESIRLADRQTLTLTEAISNLVAAHLIGPTPQKRDNVVKTVTERLQSCYSHPPADAFFLSAIGSNNQTGYFAYLRHIEQVWEPDILISPTRRSAKYRRIARLQDRFTHALVQRFAMVFMSIGLPKEYEDLRDLHSLLIGDGVQ